MADVESLPQQETEDDSSFDCPACKLLLNSNGLMGIIKGIFAVKKHLNKVRKDFSPDFYAKAVKIICTAHEQLAELEKEAPQGPFVDI